MAGPNWESMDLRSLRLMIMGLILLLVVALGFYVIKPLALKWAELHQSNAELKDSVLQGAEIQNKIEQRYTTLKSLETSLFGSSGSVPAKNMESYVIGELQSISWSHRVKLDSVRPLQTKDILQFRASPFEVTLTGDYFDLFAWLQEVNRRLGFIVIETFSITPENSSPPGSLLRMKLRMASYRVATS